MFPLIQFPSYIFFGGVKQYPIWQLRMTIRVSKCRKHQIMSIKLYPFAFYLKVGNCLCGDHFVIVHSTSPTGQCPYKIKTQNIAISTLAATFMFPVLKNLYLKCYTIESCRLRSVWSPIRIKIDVFVRFHFQTVDTFGQHQYSWSLPKKFAMNSFFCQCHPCSIINFSQNVFKKPSYNFSPLEPFKENQSFLNGGTIYFTEKGACKLNNLMKRRSTILSYSKDKLFK